MRNYKKIGKVYKLVPIIGTIMESKEIDVLKLFYEEPSREWHFEEILNHAKIVRSKATSWLKKFIKEGLIKRVKEKGKMPYYISDYASPDYQTKKRIFALDKLYKSGLITHLKTLKNVESVILFGSFSRWDWTKSSDIDIFIYGNVDDLKISKYELNLHHEIQLFVCERKEDLNKLGKGLIKNIIKGDIITGNLDFIGVNINA